ncbi:MAG TPA: YdcF family protein [Kofleriaceae bacterium]|nr:YdcF family protein [Kofleriaceae bacterium]
MKGKRLTAAAAALLGAPLARQSPIRVADAAVVLGAPVRAGADGGLGPVLEERIAVGVDLVRRGLAPRLVLTGAGEAEAMAARAVALGVPAEAILVEPRARTTEENAARVAELLPEGAAVWLVTQPFHMRRAMLWFARAGLRPLAWHILGSIQHREPARFLRWIAREYGALLRDRLR